MRPEFSDSQAAANPESRAPNPEENGRRIAEAPIAVNQPVGLRHRPWCGRRVGITQFVPTNGRTPRVLGCGLKVSWGRAESLKGRGQDVARHLLLTSTPLFSISNQESFMGDTEGRAPLISSTIRFASFSHFSTFLFAAFVLSIS